MDEINLQDYVKNADAVGEVSVKVATGSTMLDGMQLDGSKLSGKPAKVYTDEKDAISHRGNALAELEKQLPSFLSAVTEEGVIAQVSGKVEIKLK